MGPHTSYFLDVMFSVIGLFFIAYMLYGRKKKKPLIGKYRVGTHDYDIFQKIVNNNKYLTIVTFGTLFFIANAIFDIRAILHNSSSHTILIVAPALNVLVLFVAIALTPFLLGQNKRK